MWTVLYMLAKRSRCSQQSCVSVYLFIACLSHERHRTEAVDDKQTDDVHDSLIPMIDETQRLATFIYLDCVHVTVLHNKTTRCGNKRPQYKTAVSLKRRESFK